jgi:hypothetical protein
MTTFVRVLLENGSKATVSKTIADTAGEAVKVLDEPAVNPRSGKPLDPEFPEKAEAAKPAKRGRNADDQNTPPSS